MNKSCTQERKFIKLMKFPTNVNSKQRIQIPANIRNTLTYFKHIVMQIMTDISLTDVQSHPQFISLMVPSCIGVPINSLKPQEEVQIQNKSDVHRVVRSKLD